MTRDSLTEEEKARNRAYAKAYRLANRDKVKANIKAWALANPDKVKAIKRKWELANPDKFKAINKAWVLANPDKVKAMRTRFNKKIVDNLNEGYVKHLLIQKLKSAGMSIIVSNEIMSKAVEAKRNQLLTYRTLKEI